MSGWREQWIMPDHSESPEIHSPDILTLDPVTACGVQFLCSVASLELCPDHYLPAQGNMHYPVLAGHMLDLGEPSTYQKKTR